MGMTIDEIKAKLDKSNLDSDTLIELTRYLEKYQKIQEIFERFQKDGNYYHHMAWLDVMEVLKDGNGNSY